MKYGDIQGEIKTEDEGWKQCLYVRHRDTLTQTRKGTLYLTRNAYNCLGSQAKVEQSVSKKYNREKNTLHNNEKWIKNILLQLWEKILNISRTNVTFCIYRCVCLCVCMQIKWTNAITFVLNNIHVYFLKMYCTFLEIKCQLKSHNYKWTNFMFSI